MLKTLLLSKTTIAIRSFCVAIVMLLTACGDEALPLGSLSDSIASINATEESDGSVTINFDPIDAPANETIEPTADVPIVDDVETTNAELVDTSEEEPADTAQVDSNQVVITNFDITVPEYQSNELLVVLYHDGQSVEATYVDGQSWTATMPLPYDTLATVEVVFFDRNGELALNVAQRTFRASSSDTQNVSISRFNFFALDYDQDGIGNITELQQGTDPLINESGFYPDRITFQYDDIFRAIQGVSASYEREIPHNRPWSERIEELPGETQGDPQAFQSVAVDIDSAGNGEYEIADFGGNLRRTGSATRSVINDTVAWEGEFTEVTFPVNNTSATFRSVTQRYSDLDFGQWGQLSNTNTGDCCLPGDTELEYSVIGYASTAEGFCVASYGYINVTRSTNIGEFFRGTPVTTSFTRANALRASNWRIRSVWNDIVLSDYELDYDALNGLFYCNFGEL